MTDVCIDTIGGNCPVQAEGDIDGWPFYFRARGERWTLEVAEPGFEACGEAVWEYGEDYGTWPDAGWMPEEEARAFIAKAADLFTAWRAEHPEADGTGRTTALLLRKHLAEAWTEHGERSQACMAAEREIVRLRLSLGLNVAPYFTAAYQVERGLG